MVKVRTIGTSEGMRPPLGCCGLSRKGGLTGRIPTLAEPRGRSWT